MDITNKFNYEPVSHLVISDGPVATVNVRCFTLSPGDQFTVNAYGIKKDRGIKIKDIKLGSQEVWPNIICVKKIKRKWWQIWKPKYIAATFMYVKEAV